MIIIVAEFCEDDPSTTWIIDLEKLKLINHPSAQKYYKALATAISKRKDYTTIKTDDSLTYGQDKIFDDKYFDAKLPVLVHKIIEVFVEN